MKGRSYLKESGSTRCVRGAVECISSEFDLVLSATGGRRLICNSPQIFEGSIGSEFSPYNTVELGTGPAGIVVWQMIYHIAPKRIFDDIGAESSQSGFTQEQVIQLVTRHRDWLIWDDVPNYVLMKMGDEKWVVDIRDWGGKLSIHRAVGADQIRVAEGALPRFVTFYDVRKFRIA